MSDEVPVPPSPDVVAALGGSQVPPAPDVSNLPATGRPAPNPPLPQQQTQQGPPRLGQPNIVSLISGLIKPPMQMDTSSGYAINRPVSRTDVFERFLGNFLYSMGAGLQASGHGPGAFGRGLGAAITAGPQRDLQQYELGQQQQAQQAGIAREQAQTELTQRQAQMAGQMATVNLPGFGPVSMPLSALSNFYKGGFGAAVSAQTKLTVEELKDKAATGQVARVMPGIDPQTNQPAMLAYSKQNQLVGVVPGALNPATLPKVSTQQQWLQTSPGVWELVNKTSTTQTVIPSELQQKVPALAPQPAPPSGFPRPTGATSTPVARPAGATTPQGGRKIYGGGSIFAFDPVNNERVLTTPAEAAKNGWTNPVPVHEGDIDKYRSSQVQFNDTQSNVSRFRSAAQRAMQEGMNPLDGPRIDNIINKSGLAELQLKVAEGGEIKVPIMSAFLETVNRESRSSNYKSLSPAGKDLVDGYFRTMAAVPAYQKALSNIGRSNKEMLDLELANIPNPTMAPADIMRKLQAFQENIDQGSAGIPRMPGIPTIKDIRQKFESGGQQQTVSPDLQRLLGGIQ